MIQLLGDPLPEQAFAPGRWTSLPCPDPFSGSLSKTPRSATAPIAQKSKPCGL